jgi:Cu+-exporting ATPase
MNPLPSGAHSIFQRRKRSDGSIETAPQGLENAMPDSRPSTHDHSHHPRTGVGAHVTPDGTEMKGPHREQSHRHHDAGGSHVMPDGTVMEGASHDHGRHAAPSMRKTGQGAEGAVEYTCPMHPQIRRIGPGSCPLCGMALEPVLATAGTGDNAELRDMTRRFWIGLALSVPVAALEMGGHLTGLDHYVSLQTSNWLQLLLGTPAVLWAGWPFFVRGWASLLNRSLNMFTLIALGTGAAWLYSIVGTVAPQLFPAELRGEGGAVPVYFEAASVITVLVLLGQVLELRARERTSGALKALLDLAPKTAVRVNTDGSDETVPLDTVQVGELLRVRPGEKVPLDGEVTEGRATIDESMVTGEPIPVAKSPGSTVTGGTMNQTGGFVMRAEKVGSDTLLAQIVHMVAASAGRAARRRFAGGAGVGLSGPTSGERTG